MFVNFLMVLVFFSFTLSGFAALLYQTVWMRLFSISFGTSDTSVVVVLAGFMGGLAAGALIAAQLVERVRRPLFVYGVLEAMIAMAALLVPQFVEFTGELYAWFFGGQPMPPDSGGIGQILYHSLATVLVLIVPTGLIGATLPILVRYVVTLYQNLGRRVGLLYAMNTVGAVAGTLIAGFLLLPDLGLHRTVWVGVAANLLASVTAILLSFRARPSQFSIGASRIVRPIGNRFVAPIIAFSGVLSFTFEVLWVRMLSHVLGSSVYAFSKMLAAFLTGIALGAAGSGLLSWRSRNAIRQFGWCHIGAALGSVLVYSCLRAWTPSIGNHALLAFAVMLPSAICIGATYPLAVRAHAGDTIHAGRSSAIVYF